MIFRKCADSQLALDAERTLIAFSPKGRPITARPGPLALTSALLHRPKARAARDVL